MTDLLFIRKKFVSLSGRYDLVSSVIFPNNLDNVSNNWTDRGANFFIQAGQRFLDREMDFHKMSGELTFSLATTATSLNLSGNVRAIREVVVQDSVDDEQFNLIKKDVRWLRWKFGGDASTLGSTDVGEPKYYAPGLLRTAVSPNATTAVTTEVQRQLVIMPPADRTYTILAKVDLEGNLEADTDITFFSHQFPEILVLAAMYQMEIFNRNTQGQRDHLEPLRAALRRLDDDVVKEESEDTEPRLNAWDFIHDQASSLRIEVL